MQRSVTAKDLDLDALNAISAVIGRDETNELLQSLVTSMEAAFADMTRARRSEDSQAIARAAHRLAGACGSLGAIRLQDQLRILERAALALGHACCDAELAQLPGLGKRLRMAVEHYTAIEAIAG